ncbi:MAG: alpha-amylase family glycosyl hydrolase, partial [Bacteroides sp.]|nr:alpha-amylase family glycosyl hydrolase [Bacteroides sp.]
MSKIVIFLTVSLFLLSACGHKEVVLPETPGIYDLASPVRLSSDTTKVLLADYFLFPEKVKKVKVSSGLKVLWSDDRKELMLIREGAVEPMGNLRLTYEGYVYDIPVINPTMLVAGETDKAPEIYTDRVDGDTVWLQSRNPVKEWLVYLQNHRLGERYFIRRADSTGILIPAAAAKVRRSEMRVWAINGYGVSNDIFIPLEYGKVILDASLLNRFDKRASVLYFLMIDRFNDSMPENNHPLNTKEVLPIADYMGGDLAGVTQKLKEGYFDSLGINTIWLSPVTQNPEGAFGLWKKPRTKFSGYHGYWPVSSSKVDYRYGTSDELKELVEE